MLSCLVLAVAMAIPCGTLLAAATLPVDLKTAANFGALAGAAITGTGNVAGDVGSGAAIAPAITSTGTIYPMGGAVVSTALADFATAYKAGKKRTPDVVFAAAHELGGMTLKPGVYKIGAAATVASPVTLDAEGDPDAVFVIQIVGALGTTAALGNVILANDAQSTNIFWIVDGAITMGAGTHMEGTLLGGATIALGAGTTLNGRALAGFAGGTIALATEISAVTGAPPVEKLPTNVVADTVTDANGEYLFEGVLTGTYVVRWDLSSLTTDFITSPAKQGNDDTLDSDGAIGDVGEFVYTAEIEIQGGIANLNVDLGLVETLPAIKTAAKAELATALATYLVENYYSLENRTTLNTAKTDGDIAIDAATDLAGVATALDEALAAMGAVPIIDGPLTTTTELGTPVAWYEDHGIAPKEGDDWQAVDYYDSDGDGVLNWQEYVAGTNPKDPESLLKIVKIRVEVGKPAYLEWIGGTSGPSAPYIIESTISLLVPDWQPVGTQARVDGINTWTGAEVLPGAARFFRVIATRDTP